MIIIVRKVTKGDQKSLTKFDCIPKLSPKLFIGYRELALELSYMKYTAFWNRNGGNCRIAELKPGVTKSTPFDRKKKQNDKIKVIGTL